MERVELSLNSYLGFWYNLTLHVDPDTCILYKTTSKKANEPCTTIKDLVNITGATISSFYRFYREAAAKKYIASINFNVFTMTTLSKRVTCAFAAVDVVRLPCYLIIFITLLPHTFTNNSTNGGYIELLTLPLRHKGKSNAHKNV